MKRTLFVCAFFLAPPAYAAEPSQCVSIDRNDGRTGSGYSYLVNNCDKKLWVSWFDHGNCRTGCGETVSANGRKMISPVKGSVRWAACIYPQTVASGWRGDGQYSCR